MSKRTRRAGLVLAATLVALCAALPAVAGATPKLSFDQTGYTDEGTMVHRGDERIELEIRVRNSGTSATSGTIGLSIETPPGVEIGHVESGNTWTCNTAISVCTSSQTGVAAGAAFQLLKLRMWLDPEAPTALTAEIVTFGGGSQSAFTSATYTQAPGKPFEILNLRAAACATGITGTVNTTASSNQLTQAASAQGSGDLTLDSQTVTGLSTTIGRFVAGQRIFATGIPAETTIESVDAEAGTLELSAAASADGAGVALVAHGFAVGQVVSGVGLTGGAQISAGASGTASLSEGVATLANVSAGSGSFAIGQRITGAGIPANTTITALGSGTLTLSAPPTASATGVAIYGRTTITAVNGRTLTITAQASASAAGAHLVAIVPPESPPAPAAPGACADQELGGEEYTAAAGHPFGAASDFQLPLKKTVFKDNTPGKFIGWTAVETLRNAYFELPAGFIGNLNAVPDICTFPQVLDQQCPASAAVGGVDVDVEGNDPALWVPLYRIVPEDGYVAAFAIRVIEVSELTYVFRAKLRANGDYGVTVVSPLPPHAPPVVGLGRGTLCSYGVKRDANFDYNFDGCLQPGEPGAFDRPFLTNPTRCGGEPPVTSLRLDSFENPGKFNDELFPDLSDPDWKSASVTAPANTGCEPITAGWTGAHEPTFSFQPDSDRAAASAAYTAELHVPKAGLEDEGLANSHLKDTRVILPEGISLNPSAADGLKACSLADVGYLGNEFPEPNRIRFKTTAPGCPGASKVATVQVTTPVLEDTLPGVMYLAAQKTNPFGSDFAVYLVVDDPKTGIKATIPGEVVPDPKTGQILTTFADNPQAPIEDVHVEFFAGPRASLTNPDVCGDYEVKTEMTPWSAADPYAPQPEEIAVPTDQVGIATAPAGMAGCAASRSQRPFNPSFSAGSRGIGAGQHSPFTLRMTRADGEQEFDRVTVNTPPGFTAALRGVATCPAQGVAQARARTASGDGALEMESPSCPANSKVGTTTVGAGSGPTPVFVKGNAYLSGPYKGAPLSLAFIVPAVAGPFDLGVQVVQTALHVDPITAQIKAEADPIPQLLRGVPVQIRDIRVDIDRDNFTLNPTNCEAMAISASVLGGSGAQAELGNRFQVGECENLAFKPRTTLRLFGGVTRAKYQGVRAVVRPRPGDANIAGAVVRFPSSAFVAQEHLQNICTRVQWAADACPANSVYGTAEAISPLLDEPLSGKVHLRSSNNLLPDLVADLRGPEHRPIRVEVAVKNDSVKGALRNTVQTAPDAPVTLFRMQVFGGNKGLIVNSRNICKGRNDARVSMRAHNGRRSVATVPVRNARCGKWRKAQKRKAAKRKRMAAKQSARGARR